jgi:glycosyltransferase involved in cell wall biosynthesis
MIRFSVVVPVYNRETLIERTIKSVLSQTMEAWEMVIVDDGSTDATAKFVLQFNDTRIRYIYQNNAERSAARNNGITKAIGEWICFLDSDDEYKSDHLFLINEFIEKEKPAPGLIATGMTIHNGETLKKKEFLDLKNNILCEIGEKFLIPTQVCVHRSILEKEKFDIRFRLWEDTHLWLRIAAQYPVYQIKEYTAIQNIHDEGTVAQGMKNVRIIEVEQYLDAIDDLQINHWNLFKEKLSNDFFKKYKSKKHKMYLYQARQNKQFFTSLIIFWKGFFHSPSLYFLSELPKIFLNKLKIGLHDK